MISQAITAVPFPQGIPRLNQDLDWGSNHAAERWNNEFDKFIDISSLNVYYGWYTPSAKDLEPALIGYHRKYPDAVLGLSEYGAGANPLQHQVIASDFAWDLYKSTGPWHPEEYQNYFHESSYAVIKKHPEL
ncbi:hypothetical protein [Paenibacillus periandrae]|uniref:hypothetical protein n=1 Tax=Paenibacillus periandrae TaxID=1761741 RepID=UPI001F093809|nr:hypothetical protein [Paenibacillus periandrae]